MNTKACSKIRQTWRQWQTRESRKSIGLKWKWSMHTRLKCNILVSQKKKIYIYIYIYKDQIIFKFPRALPNTLPHHSFSLISLSLWSAHSFPFFSFFSFSLIHSSLSLSSSPPVVPYHHHHHFHHHFSDKITEKFLKTYKHLHILFLR